MFLDRDISHFSILEINLPWYKVEDLAQGIERNQRSEEKFVLGDFCRLQYTPEDI